MEKSAPASNILGVQLSLTPLFQPPSPSLHPEPTPIPSPRSNIRILSGWLTDSQPVEPPHSTAPYMCMCTPHHTNSIQISFFTFQIQNIK